MINMYSLSADEHSTLVRISFYVILGRRGCHFLFYASFPHQKKKKKIIISMHGKKPVRSGTETFFVFPSCRAVIVDGEEISEVRYWNVREEREKTLQFGFLYIIVFYECYKTQNDTCNEGNPRTGPASVVRVPNIAFELLKFFSSLK